MISLFDKLTSSNPVVRSLSSSESDSIVTPVWIQIRDRGVGSSGSIRERSLLWERLVKGSNLQWLRRFLESSPPGRTYITHIGGYSIRYTSHKWNPTTVVNKEETPLPSSIGERKVSLVRSPGRNTGFKDITGFTSRIKAFTLSDALNYSYVKDIRFNIALCAILGFSIWWFIATEPLVFKPEALTSPDINVLINVSFDTFINKVCSNHPLIKSPCECGEPL